MSLPGTVYETVLAFVNRPLLLQLYLLPKALHESAVHAAHPSIHSSASITVPYPGIPSVYCTNFWQALSRTQNLQTLVCTRRVFEHEWADASYVFQHIANLTSLVSLKISWYPEVSNCIQDLTGCLLHLTLLTKLDMLQSSAFEDDVQILADAIAKLKNLVCLAFFFHTSSAPFSALTSALGQLASLKSLHIALQSSTPEDADRSSLEMIHLLSACTGLTHLSYMDLSSTQLLPKLMQTICSLSQLVSLEFAQPDADSHAAWCLHQLSSLQVMGVFAYQHQVVDSLHMLCKLRELYLAQCSVTDAQFPQLALQFSILTDLQILNLRSNLLTGKSSATLEAHITNLQSLRDIDLSDNTGCPGPEECGVVQNAPNSLFKCLEQLPDLQAVSLALCNIGCEAVVGMSEDLTGIRFLSKLDLSWNGFREVEAKALANYLPKLSCLKYLSLNDCKLRTTEIVCLSEPIGSLVSLECLRLEESKIGSEGMLALAPQLCNLTALEKLDAIFFSIGSDGLLAVCEHLACLKSLRWLDFHGCGIDDSGAGALAPALARLTSLEHLNLSGNKLTDVAAIQVAPSIANLVKLKMLLLYGSKFTDEGMLVLVHSISKLTRLEDLHVDDCSGMEKSDRQLRLLSQEFCPYQILQVHQSI